MGLPGTGGLAGSPGALPLMSTCTKTSSAKGRPGLPDWAELSRRDSGFSNTRAMIEVGTTAPGARLGAGLGLAAS